MSDQGDYYEYDVNEYDYDEGIDIEEQNEENEQDTKIENQYYEAEDKLQTNPKQAIIEFRDIIEIEKVMQENQKWSFKSLLNIIIKSCELGIFEQMQNDLTQIIKLMDQQSKNEANEAISKIIETLSLLNDPEISESLFEKLLYFLEEKLFDQLWFTAALKLIRIYFDRNDMNRFYILKNKILEKCAKVNFHDQQKKSSILLELYAFEMILCISQQNITLMKQIYNKCKQLNCNIMDPKSQAVIKECRGKLLILEKSFSEADKEMLEAFKLYSESGNNTKAKDALKYLTIAGILSNSQINHFSTREAKAFKDDYEIQSLQQLRLSFEKQDFASFMRVINDQKSGIQTDHFLSTIVKDLIKVISIEKIKQIIKPYTRVRIKYIMEELQMSRENALECLIKLILDGEIKAKIDSVNDILTNFDFEDMHDIQKIETLRNWVNEVKKL